MAEAQGLSRATIRRIWKRHNFKLHLVKVFKISCDQYFVEKLQDVIGLYLTPSGNADTLAATTSALPSAFHVNIEFVGKHGRAMVPRPHRSVHPSRQFQECAELSAAIRDYLYHHNQSPRIFVWTAPVERILTKAAKCKAVLDALH